MFGRTAHPKLPRPYWRPASLDGNPIWDRIDAELLLLRDVYRKVQEMSVVPTQLPRAFPIFQDRSVGTTFKETPAATVQPFLRLAFGAAHQYHPYLSFPQQV